MSPPALRLPARPDRGRCDAFLAQLEEMPRAWWLAVGARALAAGAAGATDAARVRAAGALAAVLGRERLAVDAWLLRDAVETAAQLAACDDPAPPRTRRRPSAPCTDAQRRALAAARAAAEQAALAHLARPWLARADFVALLAPFLAPVRGAAGA
jgi:hypothetical protein